MATHRCLGFRIAGICSIALQLRVLSTCFQCVIASPVSCAVVAVCGTGPFYCRRASRGTGQRLSGQHLEIAQGHTRQHIMGVRGERATSAERQLVIWVGIGCTASERRPDKQPT